MPSGLCEKDIKNLIKYFPSGSGHSPASANWAVIGGGATKFLLEAEWVGGAKVFRPPRASPRTHKDLDIYAFKPGACKIPLDRPHEILRVLFWKRPKKYDYRERDPNQLCFCIEVLRGSTCFGFPPPRRRDIVHVRMSSGLSCWAVRPEYIVATRLFSHLPVREEDLVDVEQLRQRFTLNVDVLVEIVRRGPFQCLPEDELRHLCERLSTKDIEAAAKAIVESRFNCVANDEEIASWARGLLVFRADEWSLPRFVRMREDLQATQLESFDAHMSLAVALALNQLIEIPPRWLMNLFRPSSKRRALRVPPKPLCLRFLRYGIDFERTLAEVGMGQIYAQLLPRLFKAFCQTAFKYVFLAELATMSEHLLRARTHKNRLAILQRFLTFIGWPSWRKQVIL